MKFLFFALPLMALAACGNDDKSTSDKDVLMASDIDGLVGWLSDPNVLSKGEAHSGKYCLRVDQTHEFSPGYTAVLGQLSPTRVRGVKLEAWAYASDKDAAAKLEFVLKDPEAGKEILRDQTILNELGGYGKWVKVSKDIVFPASVSYTSQIIIYVSRAGSTGPAYVDDIKLTALR